jgi:superfamily II DNA/RNA helicase
MDLRQDLLHGLSSCGFKRPSEIQSLAIALIKQGRSVFAQAKFGASKTAAFTLGILDQIDLSHSALTCQI